jgi:secretion/DNA translocation related TadE-like protein
MADAPSRTMKTLPTGSLVVKMSIDVSRGFRADVPLRGAQGVCAGARASGVSTRVSVGWVAGAQLRSVDEGHAGVPAESFVETSLRRDERGAATIWAVCALLFVSAAVGAGLLWVAAEGTRHSVERAADTAALAAASAALRGLAMQDGSDPCVAAAKAATQAGAHLVMCGCVPLDCTVTVRRSPPFLGAIAARLPGFGPVDATSRAGPADESAGDAR